MLLRFGNLTRLNIDIEAKIFVSLTSRRADKIEDVLSKSFEETHRRKQSELLLSGSCTILHEQDNHNPFEMRRDPLDGGAINASGFAVVAICQQTAPISAEKLNRSPTRPIANILYRPNEMRAFFYRRRRILSDLTLMTGMLSSVRELLSPYTRNLVVKNVDQKDARLRDFTPGPHLPLQVRWQRSTSTPPTPPTPSYHPPLISPHTPPHISLRGLSTFIL